MTRLRRLRLLALLASLAAIGYVSAQELGIKAEKTGFRGFV